MRRLMLVIFMGWPILSFGQRELVTLTADQAKALVIAYQALGGAERDQLDVAVREDSEHFIVSFGRGLAKSRAVRGGGTRIISYTISKSSFEILSNSQSLAR